MKLFVAKLDYSIDSDELQSVFESCGTVNSSNVIMDRETGRSKGFGFVEMSSDEEAQTAISNLDGATVKGRQIVVKQAEDNRNRDNRGGGGRSNRW